MTTPQLLSKNVRTMPKWVSEANERIGPKPPPPPPNGSTGSNGTMPKAPVLPPKVKNTPEPDYEVIEFSSQQQYSNEPMKTTVIRTKTPDNKLKCTLCGSQNPWVTCEECAGQIFCASCDDMFHKHPKRKQHMRKAVQQGTPPLPPKAPAGPTPPIAPPRRTKRGLLTPFLGRKEQMQPTGTPPLPLPPPSPTPSHRSSIGSWRGQPMNNRPLPETPKSPATPSEGGGSSRSGTPKSVFDTIQRPPSVQLEKIKSKASATLDRMAILQQRYRQQKAQQDCQRSDSANEQHLANGAGFEHWSNISPSPSHFRSGSMSSGLNSSHFDLSDDSHNFHNSLLLQQQQRQQRQAAGAQRRQMSTSVFNLNTLPRRPLAETQPGGQWMANQRMQQAQSMAQINCAGCQSHQPPGWPQQPPHMHPDDWSQFGSQQQFNHSNLSLNVGPGYMPQQHPHYPPPVFMTQRGIMPNMYPTGYPVMHPGVMGMPPAAASRATSRPRYAASPTPSRKSMSMRRKRTSYVDDELTDDEDSDQDDRRSLVSNRSGMTSASRAHQQHQRQRRLSSASQLISASDEVDGELRHGQRQHKMRDRRGSIAKSVQSEWLPERRDSSGGGGGGGTLKRQTEPTKPSRIYSDLESEGSVARALVQAKIQEKLKETEQHKPKKSEAKPKREMKDENTQAAAVVQKAAPVAAITAESEDEYEEVVEEVTASESEAEAAIPAAAPSASETTAEVGAEGEAEADDLGPPPSTPDHEWECEFCTYVNEPNIKICAICCKTPCKPPVNTKAQTAPTAAKSEPKPTKTETTKATAVQPEVKLVRKPSLKLAKPSEKVSVVNNAVTPKPKTTSSSTSTSTKTIAANKTATTATATSKPTHKITPKSTLKNSSENESDNSLAKGFIHKESVENIWNTLDESIQAQAEQVLKHAQKVSTGCGGTPPNELVAIEESRQAREIGTSPPPQSISTQTYDALPFGRETASVQEEEPTAVVQERFKTPEPPKMERRPYYRSSSQLPQENERYRSANDLRYNIGEGYGSLDHYNTSQMTRRPNFITDLKMLQHQTSSPFDLPHEPIGYKHESARDPETELHIILKELELYKFTVEELEAALKYCGPETHPIQWLRENWHKLVQTVQSLSTKYGQERAENTIGTVSQNEAREALRNSSGNVWQAVADCIQQRQQKYRKLAAKGNYLRDDIVNALTAHQGNVDQALLELNRTQLKPFLMRIWGSPNGVENESGAIDTNSDIHDFLNTHALDCLQTPLSAGESAAIANPFDALYIDDNHSPSKSSYATPSPYQLEDSTLKNLEILIGNMEQKQAQQNQDVLRSIESMLETFKGKPEQDYETDPEVMRILTKSPINTQKISTVVEDKSAEDVKNFVWQHIQEIVPNLVQQVEQELMERPDEQKAPNVEAPVVKEPSPPPVDPSIFIMEEVIKPNLRDASIREELSPTYIYATEIANFKLEFDRGLETSHEMEWELDDLEDAEHLSYKSYIAPKEVAAPTEAAAAVEQNPLQEVVQSAEAAEQPTEYLREQPPIEVEKEIETVVEVVKSTALETTEIVEIVVEPGIPHDSKENLTQVAAVALNDNEKVSDEAPTLNDTKEVAPQVDSADDRPSTSREANKKYKRSQLPRKGRARDYSQRPTNRTKLPQNIDEKNQKSNISVQDQKDIELSIAAEQSTQLVQPNEMNKETVIVEEKSNNLIAAIEAVNELVNLSPETVAEAKIVALEIEQINVGTENDLRVIIAEPVTAEATTIEAIPEAVRETADNELILTESTVAEVEPEIDQIENNDAPELEIVASTDMQTIPTTPERGYSEAIEHMVDAIQTNIPAELETTMEAATDAVVVHEVPINDHKRSPKRFSKIPVRTQSTSSLRSESRATVTQEDSQQESSERVPETEVNEPEQTDEVIITQTRIEPTTTAEENIGTTVQAHSPVESDEIFEDATEFSSSEELRAHDEAVSDAELYSLDSDETEADLREEMRSPQSEVLLVLHTPDPVEQPAIVKSRSSATISSHSSQSETAKVGLKEFIPSGDPAKQNLSELVEDTQRLIKQMREEISMDEFESSDEDSPYSDEYDEGEEEDWYDSEGEEEGDYEEEDGTTYDGQTPFIEEASSGVARLEDEDEEGTDIEDIIEEDENEEEIGGTQITHESVTPTSTATPTNHESELDDGTATVYFTATETVAATIVPTAATEKSLPQLPAEAVEAEVLSALPIAPPAIIAGSENRPVELPVEVLVESQSNEEQPIAMEDIPALPITPTPIIVDSESRPMELPVEVLVEEQPMEVEPIIALPITPAPPLDGSESRPVELPTETVLDEPKKVTTKTTTTNKQKAARKDTNTEEPGTSKGNTTTTITKATKATVSKIPKPTNEPNTNPTPKKLPLRSKSFSGPPIGISSVKRIQQEYLKKQSLVSGSLAPSRVPLKTTPTTFVPKQTISEAINRFSTSTALDGPSTSSGAAAANAIFKTRAHPRIPKKKYHETCFSDDDYETTTDEEQAEEEVPEPIRAERLQRKLSMPVFRAYPSVKEQVLEDPLVLARKYVEQDLVSNIAEAQIAATLVNMKFQEDVALWAAKECSDLDQAIAMLQQECELCMNNYPMNQIVSMLKCTHKCCKQCAKSYFTVQITDRSINDCSCPYCKLPELSNEPEHEDEHLEYFSNLDIFLKSILDTDVHELFQRKLRDRTLLQDPNFKWCIQCSSGFFARPKQKRLICPDCGSVTCAQCRKPWERKHEGSTCEAYLQWSQENDPELQAQGVQEHLALNGIDCPKCKFRYSLARGGCMHFTCTQCKFEFCYGCARPFMMGAKCTISPYCSKLGLHAHHPRNCLFYLRDKIPLQLQFLLKEQKVQFDTEPLVPENESSSSSKARASERCPIPLQKETPQGLVDTVCNSEVPEKHAGMCRTHYVEYLAAKVAKAGIDPLPIFDLTDCVQELRRRGIALPERGPWDTDEIYKNMCTEVIKQHIPLKSA